MMSGVSGSPKGVFASAVIFGKGVAVTGGKDARLDGVSGML